MYFGPLPTFIYKYQSHNLAAFVGDTLRFSIGETFNDIYDGQIYPGAESLPGIEALKGQFIYCTSKSCHNNVMWGNYADEHKGFCIGYNPRLLIAQTNAAFADSIKYTDSPLLDDVDDLEYGGIISPSELHDVNCQPYTIPNIVKLQFRKEKSWQYEEEFRLVLADANPEMNHFMNLSIDHLPIEKIIFGFRSEMDLIYKVMNKFRDTNIMFFQATPSRTEYKIRSDDFLYFKDGVITRKSCRNVVRAINMLILGNRKKTLYDDINSHMSEYLLSIKNGEEDLNSFPDFSGY